MVKASDNKKRSFLFIKNSWTLVLIIILIVLFITHLIAFFTLSRYSQNSQLKINRGIIARQIITLIEAVEINPPEKRAYIVNAIDIPNIRLSLNSYPKYSLKVSQLKIWDVLLKIQTIPKSSRTMKISVKFADRLWLNISASVLQSSWNIQLLLFGFELLIILMLVLVLWSVNRYNKPLKRFIQSVEQMGRSLSSPPLSEKNGPLMVREASAAINKMQKRIRHLVQDRTQMLAAISHDLRTPITRLKLRAQLLEDQEQQQKITEDLNEMEKMINESLAFFRDEQLALEKSKIDLASLLTSLCVDYQEVGSPVKYSGPPKNCTIEGNSLALKRAFSNLINNAIKYGKEAHIKLMLQDNYYLIHIDDKGSGIPQEEFEKVFKPFYRGEQSRSKATGGIGLGLAVTQSITFAHNGELEFKHLEPKGFRVTVKLKRFEQQKT